MNTRNDDQLIKSAISDKDFKEYTLISKDYAELFNYYKVDLTSMKIGFQPNWIFLILKTMIEDPNERYRKIYKELNSVFEEQNEEKEENPILVISDYNNIDISSEFDFRNENIFFLDHNDLINNSIKSKIAFINSPLVTSVKNKKTGLANKFVFNPYSPGRPATSWRFYGRKKELDKILNSDSNFFIIGSRRIGKTSIIERLSQIYKERGHTVINIGCQYLNGVSELITEIKSSLSYREHINIQRRKIYKSDANYIESVIKALVASNKNKKKIVLIFDELGTIYKRNPNVDDWRFLGVLRDSSHRGEIKIIASGWQEIIRKQSNFEGPFVNFGESLKLYPFTSKEIEEFFIQPLSVWTDIHNSTQIIEFLQSNYGSMPFFLQVLGSEIFTSVFANKNEVRLLSLIKQITRKKIYKFNQAVDHTFFELEDFTALDKYVFLKFCHDSIGKDPEETNSILTIDKCEKILKSININLDLDSKLKIMKSYEYIGLMKSIDSDETQYNLTAPIIYNNVKNRTNIESYLSYQIRDIKMKKAYE